MIDTEKSQKTQAAELDWWEREWETYVDYRWLSKRAAFFESWIELYTELSSETIILEIGGAGLPIVDFMQTGVCFGIDPLYNSYKELFEPIYNAATRKVTYHQRSAEDTGMDNSFFDVIIMLNVLDHTYYPNKILQEIHRILKVDGVFLMSVDTGNRLFKILKKTLQSFKIGNVGLKHPQIFTVKDICNSLEQKFKLLHLFSSSYDSIAVKEDKVYKEPHNWMFNRQRLYCLGKKQ